MEWQTINECFLSVLANRKQSQDAVNIEPVNVVAPSQPAAVPIMHTLQQQYPAPVMNNVELSTSPSARNSILQPFDQSIHQNVPILVSPIPSIVPQQQEQQQQHKPQQQTFETTPMPSYNLTETIPQQTQEFRSNPYEMQSLIASSIPNYLVGPHINPAFSNIIELPVTPSPPPLLEVDENVDSDPSTSPSKQGAIDESKQQENAIPSIPTSHLNATNPYPSLNKIPPANIVHSFAPVYSQQYRPQTGPVEGELYNDYANNPYNLTLQVEQNYCANSIVPSSDSGQQILSLNSNSATIETIGGPQTIPQSTDETTTTSTANLNVFQSLNYFGNSNDSSIPPGSELLFGGP